MEEQNTEKKHFPVLPVTLCGLALAASAAYGGGLFHYQNHFLPGTTIDRIDVSGMTIEELEAQVQDYVLGVVERKTDGSTLEEEIQGKDIGLSYGSSEPLEDILEGQNSWSWFLPQSAEHTTEGLIVYEEEKLKEQVMDLQGFQDDFTEEPADAYISEYTPENGFEIVPETQGNTLDPKKTLEVIREAVSSLEERIDLDAEGCYEEPAVTADDGELAETLEKLQKYADIRITYTFGEEKEILDGGIVSQWLQVNGTEVTLDKTQVEAYVAALRKSHDTIFRPRTFQTSYGKEITINKGDYGWWMNSEQEVEELTEMIEQGESGERTPVYHQTAQSYGSPDYGDTYVEINLTAQHLFLYKDGKVILESDFVSGNSARGYDTPGGIYGVTYKQRNATLNGENYSTPVSYWMPFNLNIGMHDANWRGSFGGNIYKTNGSHGCINLGPPAKAKEIYENIEKGTPVICYYMPGTEPVVMEKGAPSGEESGQETPAGAPAEAPAEVPAEVPAETPAEVPPESVQ